MKKTDPDNFAGGPSLPKAAGNAAGGAGNPGRGGGGGHAPLTENSTRGNQRDDDDSRNAPMTGGRAGSSTMRGAAEREGNKGPSGGPTSGAPFSGSSEIGRPSGVRKGTAGAPSRFAPTPGGKGLSGGSRGNKS